jgi:hypothetical protein
LSGGGGVDGVVPSIVEGDGEVAGFGLFDVGAGSYFILHEEIGIGVMLSEVI